MRAPEGRLWRETLQRLDAATSKSAFEAFERGSHSGAREFLLLPARAFCRGLARSGGNRFIAAPLAAFATLVHAGKLLEHWQLWREHEAHLEARKDVDLLYRHAWRAEVYGVSEGSIPLVPYASGRGGTFIAETDRGRLVVRSYRRGGAMRWAGDRYFGVYPRPIGEFWLMLEARRRGLSVPEPVAAEVRRAFPGMYRGRLIMREIENARTLAEAVAERIDPGLAVRAGRALRGLFDGGLWHDDLNLTNILETPDGISFVDLDRARLREEALPEGWRRVGLHRLRRSAPRHTGLGVAVLEPWLDRLEKTCLE